MTNPQPDTGSNLGLYIHWPFCARICPYCDFNVYRNRNVDEARWTKALIADLRYWAKQIEPRPLTSIYFGGGTPSLAPPRLIGSLIDEADRLFGFSPNPEITLEANPHEATFNRLDALAKAGINRVSLGVQSFNDEALGFLGRDHDGASAREAITLSMDIFERITFDLIYARPEQSLEEWHSELEQALAFNPSHLSLYQLTIEPGTAFAKAVDAGRWAPADEEMCAAQFDLAQEMTSDSGRIAYEVSNHAKPGHESRHNLLYWRGQDYIGIGPGAHGRVAIDGKRIATQTFLRPENYLSASEDKGTGCESTETLSAEDILTERLSMGLRLSEGISLYADDYFYSNETRVEKLHQLTSDGLLVHHCGTLRATPDGRRVLNRLIYELLS